MEMKNMVEEKKKWYKSKTLWTNAIAIGAIIIESKYGYPISAEIQLLVLGWINFILRIITKEEIIFR
jgi:hypothetical protein